MSPGTLAMLAASRVSASVNDGGAALSFPDGRLREKQRFEHGGDPGGESGPRIIACQMPENKLRERFTLPVQ